MAEVHLPHVYKLVLRRDIVRGGLTPGLPILGTTEASVSSVSADSGDGSVGMQMVPAGQVGVVATLVSGSGLLVPKCPRGESFLADLWEFQQPRDLRDLSSTLDTLSVPRLSSGVAIVAAFTGPARRIVAAEEGGQGVVMEPAPAAELEPVAVAATALPPNQSTGVLAFTERYVWLALAVASQFRFPQSDLLLHRRNESVYSCVTVPSAAHNVREHGGVERRVRTIFERPRAVFGDDLYAAVASVERWIHDTPSVAHKGLSPFEIVFGVRGGTHDRFDFSPDERSPVDLSILLAVRFKTVTSSQHCMLRDRIDRLYRRKRAAGLSTIFAVGDSVELLQPPSDKMNQSGIAPYVVVSADDSSASYNVALIGPASELAVMATRAAAGQLRPFDKSCTTYEYEWRRLQWQEFDDDTCLTRAVMRHRKSRRPGADARDLEFEVIWITDRGDVTTWEPALYLSRAGNVDFKEYVRQALLVSRVCAQVSRERSVQHDGE